jgi:TolB protein
MSMTIGRRAPTLRAISLLLAGLAAACQDPVADPGLPATGALTVSVSTAGGAFDLDGFVVMVDGDSAATVDVNDQVDIVVREGLRSVGLSGLAPNCTAGSVQQATVAADGESHLAVAAFCVPPTELHDLRILFEDGTGLVLMNADGTDRVTHIAGTDLHAPHVTADGTRLVFVKDHPNGSHLWVADADGANQAKLVEGGRDPRWSPDGNEIVYGGWAGIHVTSADGSTTSVLAVNFDPVSGWYRSPTWSPDGSLVAFDDAGYVVHVVERIGSTVATGYGDVRVVAWGGYPTWGPTGEIAYAGYAGAGSSGGAESANILLTYADGMDARTIYTTPPWAAATHPTDWSADGTLLLFTQISPSGGIDIYLLDVPGGTTIRVTGDGRSRSPVFWTGG